MLGSSSRHLPRPALTKRRASHPATLALVPCPSSTSARPQAHLFATLGTQASIPSSTHRVAPCRLIRGTSPLDALTTSRNSRQSRYLGVTPPISTSESSEKEKEVTVTLMEELKRQGSFESEEESKTRSASRSVSRLRGVIVVTKTVTVSITVYSLFTAERSFWDAWQHL